MILLEFANQIIVEALKERFYAEEPASVDIKFADFDGVQYHISTPNNKNELLISIYWKCFPELSKFGALDILKTEYKEYVTETEGSYDFSIKLDLTKLPAAKDALIDKISLLKRNAFAAPFARAFDAQAKGGNTELMEIHYRDDETVYVQAFADRVIAIFSVTFKDDVDSVFARVFLQEFVDARRQPGLQNAPQVLYYPPPPAPKDSKSVIDAKAGIPAELKEVKNIRANERTGYVTFVLNPRHYEKKAREPAISLIQTFRDYLHYHIKCSKAYMHSRMRARVESLLKVLNRAKPDLPIERNKTASGKTFKK